MTDTPKTTLTFNKPIISTPQNPIATKDLLTRLQQLSDELSTIDQENPNLKSIEKYKSDLVNPKLLKTTNPGISAYVCCSISDILRIYAPDAPFSSKDISSIFKLMLQQFKKLSDQSNPYFHQQCYVLKRLAEVRSIILITDLNDSESLIEDIFNIFYDLSNKEFPSRLEPLISDVLSEIMAEAEVIPHNVLKMILDKLLTHQPNVSGNTLGNITDPGFNFSVNICEANIDRMSRQVAQYFSEILYESQVEDTEIKNPETLERVHKLSIQIWNFVPGLLTSVMGLIADELNADNVTIRCLATETIGQMIGSSMSSQNFIVNYKDVWNNWLKKTLDISFQVRCKWVEQLPIVINNLDSATTEIANELCRGLNKCLLDIEEKVRLSSCIAIDTIPFEKFTRYLNKEVMITLNHLTRDKTSDNRNEAIKILSNQCNKYFTMTINNQVLDFGSKTIEEAKELESIFQQIPTQILSLNYINDNDITADVDICLFEKILPFENNTIKRVERLCNVFSTLDERAKSSFFAIMNRQQQVAKVLDNYIGLCEEYGKIGSITEEKENLQHNNEDKIDKLSTKADQIIKWLSKSIPDSFNSYSCLERFYKLKNFRFIHLIKQCISPESDFLTVKNSIKELVVKLSNAKNIKLDNDKNISINDMVSTFKLVLYRSSIVLYNKSNIVELLSFSKSMDNEWYGVSNQLLEHISHTIPDVFKMYVGNLIELILDDSTHEYLRSNCIKTVYQFVKKYSELYPKSQDFNLQLKKLCLEGSPREAKYSMKLLGLSDRKELYCSQLISIIFPLDLEGENILAHLATISEVFLVDPETLEDKANDMSALLIKEVLLANSGMEVDGEEPEPISEPVSEQEQISEQITDQVLNQNTSTYKQNPTTKSLAAKLLTLRIFTNRLRSIDKHEIIQPIWKLFITIINNGGEIVKQPPTPESHQQHLRLNAGLSILKLSKSKVFNEYINNHVLTKFLYLIQDPNDSIRTNIVNKFQKYFAKDRISDRFLVVLPFMTSETNSNIKNQVTTWIKSFYKKLEVKKDLRFEMSLLRLIHLLSHHPKVIDVDREIGLKYATEVIIFYLSNIAKSDNISLLYYLASRIKQFRDATVEANMYEELNLDHEINGDSSFPKQIENLYLISELCQLIIKELSVSKGWNVLSWPGKIQLPIDLFSPMTTTFEAQLIISRVYIKEELAGNLVGFIRSKLTGKSKSKKRMNVTRATKVMKRQRTEKPKPKQKRVRREPSRKSARAKRVINYEEDEDED